MNTPDNQSTSQQEEKNIMELIEESREQRIKLTSPSTGTTPEDDVKKIVENFIKKKGLKKENSKEQLKVKLTIATLSQEGATSPRFAETRICPLFGISISVKELREECKAQSTTVRRLARALAPYAIQVAKAYDIQGNLAKNYLLTYPDAPMSELIWASDFQTFTSDNAIPERVKIWLMQNYKNRFGNKSEN